MTENNAIDARIIKTEYRNYDLIARFWNGQYRGRIWKNKLKIADYVGDNLDLILENLTSIVDEVVKQNAEESRFNTPYANYLTAWTAIWQKLTAQQLALMHQLSQPQSRSMKLDELLETGNFSSRRECIQSMESLAQRYATEIYVDFDDTLSSLFTNADLEACRESLAPFDINHLVADAFLEIATDKLRTGTE